MHDATLRNERRREIGAERRERTRTKLLAAAAHVVAELGENKATIDDFIKAAGVARGTFYNYYSTREELIEDLWASIGRNPFRDILRASMSLKDPAARLATEARLVVKRASEDHTWGWLVYALSVDMSTITDDLLSYPRPDLIIGQKSGRFDVVDLDSASDMIVGAIRTALRGVLQGERSPNYAQSLATLLLKALGINDQEAREIAQQPLPCRESEEIGRSGHRKMLA
jgi:AcrR family transcriptional regulator